MFGYLQNKQVIESTGFGSIYIQHTLSASFSIWGGDKRPRPYKTARAVWWRCGNYRGSRKGAIGQAKAFVKEEQGVSKPRHRVWERRKGWKGGGRLDQR